MYTALILHDVYNVRIRIRDSPTMDAIKRPNCRWRSDHTSWVSWSCEWVLSGNEIPILGLAPDIWWQLFGYTRLLKNPYHIVRHLNKGGSSNCHRRWYRGSVQWNHFHFLLTIRLLWCIPSGKVTYLWKMTLEIVDLPIQNRDFPWLC